MLGEHARTFEFTTPSWTQGTDGPKRGKAVLAPRTKEEFDQKLQSGNFGHVGLTESAHMIGAAMGWIYSKTKEEIEETTERMRKIYERGQ